MERLRSFLHDHGLACAVTLCAFAAVLTGAWAVNTIQKGQRARPAPPPSQQQEKQPVQPRPDTAWEENKWNTGFDVAGKADKVPEKRDTQPQPPAQQPSSGASSAGKPSKTPEGPVPSPSAAACLYGPPVSGSVIQAFSGDELVYNETLADWRTHNGVDYACALGGAVQAPVSGRVEKVLSTGRWGGTLEIVDGEGRLWRLCGVASQLNAGETVTCGQPVGQASGISCEAALGSHVHLEVEKDGAYTDPAELIR